MRKKHIDSCVRLIRGLQTCNLATKDKNIRAYIAHPSHNPILDAAWDLDLNEWSMDMDSGQTLKTMTNPNPRKFSAKISLHTAAKETAEFERIMKELRSSKSRPSKSKSDYKKSLESTKYYKPPKGTNTNNVWVLLNYI